MTTQLLERTAPPLWGSTDCLDTIHSCRHEDSATPRAEPEPGPSEEIGGYRLVRRIGEGSQAVVWEAVRREGPSRPIALRVLRADLAESPEARATFLKSARLTRRFRDRSQLPTLDSGECRGVAYQALPLVLGVNLADAITSRTGGLNPSEKEGPGDWWIRLSPSAYRRTIAGALAGVARGLAEAHAKGVAHRDVKPSNILLDRDQAGLAMLSDFGLGARVGRRPSESTPSGTMMYMAPEGLLGLPRDEFRGDIFALGMTLYEALTLQHPREVPEGLHRSTLPALLARSRPAPPRSVCPCLSRRTEAVILKAIAPDPADRYRKVSVLADELEQAVRVI